MDLKERIKELCKEKGISLNKLESDCGVAKGYISKLDKSSPSVATIQLVLRRTAKTATNTANTLQ